MTHDIELDLLIVGAGPAGVAAASQAFRDRIAAAVVTAGPPGGMLRAARTLTNLPGFDHPITGPILAKRLLDSLRATGLPVITDRVTSLTRQEGFYQAVLSGCAQVRSKTVILTTGTRPLPAPFKGWHDAMASGLAHRDASSLPERMDGQTLAVVGGGDVAFDTALIACDRGAGQVHILVRSEAPKAAWHLQAEARSRAVTIHLQAQVRDIRPWEQGGDQDTETRTKIRLDIPDKAQLVVDQVAVCIGRQPADELLVPGLQERKPPGIPVLDETDRGRFPNARARGSTQAAQPHPRPEWNLIELPPGLWIAGDLASEAPGRFVAWALGSGQQAAVRAAAFLRAHDNRDQGTMEDSVAVRDEGV